MTFLLNNWRIKSHDYGGFVTQKKVGRQWKETKYFRTLSQAALNVLEQKIHDETTDTVISTMNQASAAISKARLIRQIDGVKNQILEALDNEDASN